MAIRPYISKFGVVGARSFPEREGHLTPLVITRLDRAIQRRAQHVVPLRMSGRIMASGKNRGGF